MGAPTGMYGGGMGGMVDTVGMVLGSFGGVFGGTSAPMAGMGVMRAPPGGVYGAMGAPPGGVYGAMGAPPGNSWPPWILLYLLQLMVSMKKKKQKMEMTSKIWMSDDLFAFVICKFVLTFIMWI
jgi:hypothetical protein